ncbi:MAG TPA: DUF6049 family protein [Actinomycetota bacterium]|nr:DUF6049 family protein [Actinomycetota bacterium]
MLRHPRGPAAAMLLLALLAAPAAALAATPSASPSASPASRQVKLEATMVGFPIAVGPADSLSVALDVRNTGDLAAEGLEVALTIFQGVTSRSRLEQTYEGQLGTTLAVDTLPVEGTLRAGETRRIEVAKPLSELAKFRNSTQDRAYPVRVVVRAGRVSSNALNTHMIFFHEPPEKPLGFGLVVPLHSPPVYTDGGRPDLVTNGSLERSIAGGRLSRILDALEAHPDLPVTIAPSGLLLSTLADMADGYRRLTPEGPVDVPREDPRAEAGSRTLARLQALAARPNTRVLATTFSPASLPALYRNNLQELAATQLAEGRNVLLSEPVGLLRSQPLQGWLLPTSGDVDQPTLSQLHRANFNRLILSAQTLSPTDSPFTRALPVRLEGPGSATEGVSGEETIALVTDPGLERQIGRAGALGTIEARQRIAAESATIHLETPGLVRAVVAVAPSDWEAEGSSAAALLEVLDTASWLAPTTPDAITDDLNPPARETVRLASSDTVLDNGPDLPSSEYFAALSNARRAIARYSALAPPSDRIGALSRRLLIAESTDWWSSRSRMAQGLAFAEAIPSTVAAEMRKVLAPAPQTITLTSRTGVIPLSIGSRLGYPVDVVLRLESDKLHFPDGDRIDIANLQAPSQTIQIRAITQASGTFPLNVRLLTPGGTLISDSKLTIRSTAYNVVALSITAAAGAFLVGWWIFGWLRRRILPNSVDEQASPADDEDAGEAIWEPGAEEPLEEVAAHETAVPDGVSNGEQPAAPGPEELPELPAPVPAGAAAESVEQPSPASEHPSEAG